MDLESCAPGAACVCTEVRVCGAAEAGSSVRGEMQPLLPRGPDSEC